MNPIDTLARTIWGEARGEGREGMEAVAAVIMNRVARPCWWGRTIETVCTKPWQFSCWNSNDPNLAKLLSVTEADPSFKTAMEIATLAEAGELPDPTNGSTHYHVKTIRPDWAQGRQPCAAIGNHLFYKDIG